MSTRVTSSFYRFLPFIATNGRRNPASERSEEVIASGHAYLFSHGGRVRHRTTCTPDTLEYLEG
ncbi:hypothetical protein H1Q63_06565 [Desmonostoc muscorum CCALA 125]|nr:hypothetical protein [Desmonostoc muscorum CCALA 125]